jgi:hypothetical protein
MQIQDFLIAATQNITVLITQSKEKISKSNALGGQMIRIQGAKWDHHPLISLMRWFLARFAMAVN